MSLLTVECADGDFPLELTAIWRQPKSRWGKGGDVHTQNEEKRRQSQESVEGETSARRYVSAGSAHHPKRLADSAAQGLESLPGSGPNKCCFYLIEDLQATVSKISDFYFSCTDRGHQGGKRTRVGTLFPLGGENTLLLLERFRTLNRHGELALGLFCSDAKRKERKELELCEW
ncbi:hypothetical protein CEXT_197091 [Caerostris extrusa]|uniref:Uncharacterized protein n=1 Tax=Caerostris extrusa TaxID=172846 RepID=A0AAV4QSW6_CAEEX|nr:hypothetical protein CEXT_197091 [Caerostris extrusa]